MILRLLRWLTALTLAVAGISLTAGPATAAGGYCTGSGVNVVVDYGALSGGVVKGCGKGTSALAAFQSAGFTLERNPAMQNYFVCTINGEPSDHQCAGTGNQGYWALFWAKPHGSWAYATCGADCQSVTNGETVAFAWQTPANMAGNGHRNPGAAPAVPVTATPKPTPAPPRTRPSAGVSTRTGKTATATGKTTASASPSATAKPTKKPTPTASASASTWASTAPLTTASAKPTASSSGGSSLPWWIPVIVVAALVLGGVGTWWRRRAGG